MSDFSLIEAVILENDDTKQRLIINLGTKYGKKCLCTYIINDYNFPVSSGCISKGPTFDASLEKKNLV